MKFRRCLHLEALEPRWTMNATAPLADVHDLEQSLNQFAIDLYDTISDAKASQPTDEAISPFSIAATFAMLYAGASGETATQLAHALHSDLPPDRFHTAMGQVLHDILPAASDSSTQLEIADALWGQTGFSLLDSFLQLTHDRYGADFHEVDFKHASDDAVKQINTWVSTQTHDMIQSLFDKLPNDTRLVLANALYFKSSWATAFDPSSTRRTVFHLASGDSEDVSMMHKTGYYGYLETNDYKIVELPYQDDRYSMVILLPKETDANLTANFSAADLNNWLEALQPTDLSLALPKFKLSDSMSLIGTLKSLGVTDAFDPISANLSGIDGAHDLFVSKVEHKAVVEVDETGTKAAAVTGIGMAIGNCICSGPVPLPFYADHPFHFLIRDQQTNSILFMGQVQTPTEYSGPDTDPTELPKAGFQLVTNPNIKFKNPIDKFDVDGDGQDTPLDALIVINYINDHTPQTAPVHTTSPIMVSTLRPDVDGDGQIIALDVLLIINHLNERPLSTLATTQGEAPADTDQLLETSVVDALVTTQDDLITPSTSRLSARRA